MSDQERRQSTALDRVPIPRARPAHIEAQAAARRQSTPGLYPGLDIRDETPRFGALGKRKRRGDPSEVVLHQTASDNADSTRRGYDQRIKDKSGIGAHYLIDREGSTSLTVPTDRVSYHTKGHNSSAVGIENVGAPNKIDPKGDVRAQIEGLDLTPKLRERLLAMSDKELESTMRANRNNIYGDISGPQKRSNWNLLSRITEEHGLDMTNDVNSHENLQAKTIGEGENIEEMVDAMTSWPGKVDELRSTIHGNEWNTDIDRGSLEQARIVLQQQEEAQRAVEVDGTQPEQNAIEGERLLDQPGPAHGREVVRTRFWNDFYANMGRVNGALDDLG